MSANQPTAAWGGTGDPLVVVSGHLVSPQDGFGEIGRMANGNLRRPNRIAVGAGGIHGLAGADGQTFTRFGGDSNIILRRANGTEEAPSAILDTEAVGGVFFEGHDGTSFGNAGGFRAVAAENWAVGSHGSQLDFFTVPVGGVALTNRWQMQAAGHFVAATDNAVDIGASGATRPRDIFAARDFVAGRLFSAELLSGAGDNSFQAAVSGDAVRRFEIHADGGMEWGSGAAGRDVTLFRSAANELKTDDNFVIGALSATAISVGINDSGGAGFKLLRVPN